MQDEELVRSVDQLCWLSARAGARRKSFGADMERGVRKGKKEEHNIVWLDAFSANGPIVDFFPSNRENGQQKQVSNQRCRDEVHRKPETN